MDDPPYLTVGTEVSAKYKGAFCEAKIRKVVRVVKCRVLFKSGLGSFLISDDLMKGTLRVGATVEAKHPDRGSYSEATISKIQDCSQYTVVFDDGDITTLRRSALCLKSGRHFNESETLDQLPLTHPEHFSNPVVGGRRGVRRRVANADDKDDSSDEEVVSTSPSRGGRKKIEPHEIDFGRVVTVEISDKKKGSRDSWFPALVVSPAAQETVKIRVKDECLVRSFKDGRYYTVPKKEITEFTKDQQHGKGEPSSSGLKSAVDKAVSYLEKDELPPHWDRDALFGSNGMGDDDDDDSDSEGPGEAVREKKDNFVAQLYKFMEERATPINKAPTVCNKDLDLHKLYSVVVDQGGYSKVTNGGQWKNITGRLGFGAIPSTSTINLVKQAYKKYLLHFEEINKKLGYNIHTAAVSKPRNSRTVYRQTGTPVPPSGSSSAAGSSSSLTKKEKDQQEAAATAAAAASKDAQVDTAAQEEKRSAEKVVDNEPPQKRDDIEPRRSRSRQDSSRSRKEPATTKNTEKEVEEEKELKKRGKSSARDKDTKEKELTSSVSIKQQRDRAPIEPEDGPPSPAPSSQGSSKSKQQQPTPSTGGRGPSQRKSKKEIAAAAASSKEAASVEVPVVKSSTVEHKVDEQVLPGLIGNEVNIQTGDKLSVIYPKGDHNVTYDAKVVDVKEVTGTYFVHYLGWNTRYDEWISRERIAENLSLRENYQSKAQGKGPGAPPSSHMGDEDKGGKGKKRGRSVTPSAPTPPPTSSSTGTRSKTASAAANAPSPTPSNSSSVKRKRLSTSERSTASDEPVTATAVGKKKTKRSYKKGEKSDATSDSESEQEKVAVPPPPPPPIRTPTPTRSKANKDKKQAPLPPTLLPPTPENIKPSGDVPARGAPRKEQHATTPDTSSSTRPESKSSDKLLKTGVATQAKTLSSSTPGTTGNTAPKVSISPPNLVTGGGTTSGEQKLDIYEFEEDTSETAPKLKMFSPRSPDKKDDNKDEKEKEKAVVTTTPPTSSVGVMLTPVTGASKGKAALNLIATTASTTPQTITTTSSVGAAIPSQIAISKQPTVSGVVPPQPLHIPIITSHPPPLTVGRSPPRASGGRAVQTPPHPTPQQQQQHRRRGPAPPVVMGVGPMPRLVGPPTSTTTPHVAPIYSALTVTSGSGSVPIHSPIVVPRPGVGTLLSPYVSMTRTPVTSSGTRQSSVVVAPTVSSSSLTPGGMTPITSTLTTSKPVIHPSQPGQYPLKQEGFSQMGQQQKPVVARDMHGDPHHSTPTIAVTSQQHPIPATPDAKKKRPQPRTPSKPRQPPSVDSPEQKRKPAATPKEKEATPPKPKKRRGESPPKGPPRTIPSITGPPPSKMQKIASTPGPQQQQQHNQYHQATTTATPITTITTTTTQILERSSSTTPRINKETIPKPQQAQTILPAPGHVAITKINETISTLMHKTGPIQVPVSTGSTVAPAPTSSVMPPVISIPTAHKKEAVLPPAPQIKGKPQHVELVIPSTTQQDKISSSGVKGAGATGPVQKGDQKPPLSSSQPHVAAVIPSQKPAAVPSVSIPTIPSTVTQQQHLPVEHGKIKPSPQPRQIHDVTKPTITVALQQPPPPPLAPAPEKAKEKPIKPERKVGSKLVKDVVDTHQQSSRPLTPSFLQSQEVLEPEEDDESEKVTTTGGGGNISRNSSQISYTLSAKAVLLPVSIKDSAEESCSSLLCEEEIPGSPAPDRDASSKFDFSRGLGKRDDDDDEDDEDDEEDEEDEDEEEDEEQDKKKKRVASSRPTLLPKKGSQMDNNNKPRLVVERSESLVVMHDSPPSSPDSASFSTETGSPHVPLGEMEEEDKSKESSDNDSVNSKSYYSGSPGVPSRKTSKTDTPTSSKMSSRNSRPHLPMSSPLGKKRRMIRKKSPTDDYARQFGYRGIRSSSGRKIQSSIDVHEAIRGPPPPPVNLAKKPHSEKFNHLYANFDGVTDPEDRIALVVKSMQDIREEWMKVKGRIQVRERKERKKKRKAREKATAERQARLEAAKTLASQSQPQVGGVGGGATVAVGATTGGGSTS